MNEFVEAMASAWGEWHDSRSFPFTKNRGYCINGTRVFVSALRELGVEARPVSVTMLLMNDAGYQLLEAGVPLIDWPEHAHSIGIGHGFGATEPGAWDGHLIAEGDGWTVDVSAQTSRRPGKLAFDGPLVIARNLPPTDPAMFRSQHNVMVWVKRTPENNGWRQAAGWKRMHGEEVTELLVRTRRWLGR